MQQIILGERVLQRAVYEASTREQKTCNVLRINHQSGTGISTAPGLQNKSRKCGARKKEKSHTWHRAHQKYALSSKRAVSACSQYTYCY